MRPSYIVLRLLQLLKYFFLFLFSFFVFFFFFKQKTAYEIYQCDWSSDVCSSDLQMKHYVQQVIKKFGRIDCVIHNGGISQRSTVANTNFKVDKILMDVNYLGPDRKSVV